LRSANQVVRAIGHRCQPAQSPPMKERKIFVAITKFV
jgi:hypothetical protein